MHSTLCAVLLCLGDTPEKTFEEVKKAAQADFRSNDRDEDQVQNFWVKDIAGLYGIAGKDGAIKLIEIQVAEADRTEGRGKYRTVEEEKPAAGYHYASLKRHREGGRAVPYDDGKGRNPSRWGAIAWPAQYPQNGRLTFIASVDGEIYSKDTGGKPVDEFPEDPPKEGWRVLR